MRGKCIPWRSLKSKSVPQCMANLHVIISAHTWYIPVHTLYASTYSVCTSTYKYVLKILISYNGSGFQMKAAALRKERTRSNHIWTKARRLKDGPEGLCGLAEQEVRRAQLKATADHYKKVRKEAFHTHSSNVWVWMMLEWVMLRGSNNRRTKNGLLINNHWRQTLSRSTLMQATGITNELWSTNATAWVQSLRSKWSWTRCTTLNLKVLSSAMVWWAQAYPFWRGVCFVTRSSVTRSSCQSWYSSGRPCEPGEPVRPPHLATCKVTQLKRTWRPSGRPAGPTTGHQPQRVRAGPTGIWRRHSLQKTASHTIL